MLRCDGTIQALCIAQPQPWPHHWADLRPYPTLSSFYSLSRSKLSDVLRAFHPPVLRLGAIYCYKKSYKMSVKLQLLFREHVYVVVSSNPSRNKCADWRPQLTTYVQIQCDSIETASLSADCASSWRHSRALLPLLSCQTPEPPFHTICPIDQVEMTDTNQGSFVVSPLTRSDAVSMVS